MISACAPYVAPATLAGVIQVESGRDPLALHVNGVSTQPPAPRTKAEAVTVAERFIARGFSVDLGRMQVNSRNLAMFGVTVAQMLEPFACDNVRVGADILAADYRRAAEVYGEGQTALRAALSAYNTGSFYRGGAYVARYVGPRVPALQAPPSAMVKDGRTIQTGLASANPYSADTAQSTPEWRGVSQ